MVKSEWYTTIYLRRRIILRLSRETIERLCTQNSVLMGHPS